MTLSVISSRRYVLTMSRPSAQQPIITLYVFTEYEILLNKLILAAEN